MTHEEIKEQLPLYVLGGLDVETTTAVEQHLAEPCDSCAADLREWQEVVGLIPLGVTPDGPGESVKTRLMERVRQDRGAKVIPLRPRRWRAAWVVVPLAAAASILFALSNLPFSDRETVDALRKQIAALATENQRLNSDLSDAVKVASVERGRADTVTALLTQAKEDLAARDAEIKQVNLRIGDLETTLDQKTQQVVRLEDAAARQQSELNEQRQLVSVLQAKNAASNQQIAALKVDLDRQGDLVARSEVELKTARADLERQKALVEPLVGQVRQLSDEVERQHGIIEVLHEPGLQVARLQKAKLGVSTQGHVLWNEDKKKWLFYAFRMPQLPEGKDYQVWFMKEKESPVSAGLLKLDQTGTGVLLTKPPTMLGGKVVAAAVTLEPAGGSPNPTGEMYLRGSL
jgi:anti-sigma-K factor RskA